MTTNPWDDDARNSASIGTVTREMVEARAAELAVVNNHSARHHLSGPEWEQAQLKLTSEPDAGVSINL